MTARTRFIVHRVSEDEYRDLALLARLRSESRSETLRRIVAEEKARVATEQRVDR